MDITHFVAVHSINVNFHIDANTIFVRRQNAAHFIFKPFHNEPGMMWTFVMLLHTGLLIIHVVLCLDTTSSGLLTGYVKCF